jgi:hypothetical protein
MKIDDNLLIKMIEKDMLQKGIAEKDYHIMGDYVVEKPTQIEVKSNEVIYLCYFSANTFTELAFDIRYQSAAAVAHYTPKNTKVTEVYGIGSSYTYESSAISGHWSTITLNTPYHIYLEEVYLRYVKVVFNGSNSKG